MKTLREYIDLIDGKVSESKVKEANLPFPVDSVVKTAINAATSPGGLAPRPTPAPAPSGIPSMDRFLPKSGFLPPIAEVDDKIEPKTKSLVDFTDSDKYDNFVPPDEDEAEDYKSGVKGHKKIKDSDVYRRNGFSDAAVGGLVGSE